VNVERKTGHHLLWPSNANQNRFVAGAVCDFERKSPEQARAAGNLGDRPLIVLTAGLPIQFGDPEADKELVAFHEIWVHQWQAQLARLSTRGRQVIVENSDHSIRPRRCV
jgi:hypothetical protein